MKILSFLYTDLVFKWLVSTFAKYSALCISDLKLVKTYHTHNWELSYGNKLNEGDLALFLGTKPLSLSLISQIFCTN